jgi:hypothetical protein
MMLEANSQNHLLLLVTSQQILVELANIGRLDQEI